MVDTLRRLWLNDDMTTKTITASDLKVGDTVLSIWGTTLDTPVTITSANISPTYKGGTVRHSGGSMILVRANDRRPIVIAA